MMHRRAVLGTALGSTLLPLAPLAASTQVLGIQRRSIGDITVTALLDGHLAIDPVMLANVEPDALGPLLEQAFLVGGPVNTPINAYVIETGGRTILVDGGAAGAFGPTAGKLVDALAAAGVAPESIDTVFCTHLHPDHVGVFADGDEARFGGADLVVHGDELAFWADDGNFAGAGEDVLGFAKMAQAAVAPYAARTVTIKDGDSVAPGVTARHLPGHTPGHTGLMLDSDGETALLWGDIVHVGPVQFARPEATIPFDVDQPMAAATRAALFDEVAADRLLVAGSHVSFPSFGHLERSQEGYGFVPARWQYEL
ncbi:MAG: MBL fold metallo-hydrolase [Pseudomonadota bacterium]